MGGKLISIIIPAYNSKSTIAGCLVSIKKSTYERYEIIVVDDNSTDNTAEIACRHRVKYYKLERNRGPSACRNFGALHAAGDILFFIDSDVNIKSDTLQRVRDHFEADPGISAVTGTLDPAGSHKNIPSEYKSLYQNYVHNKSAGKSTRVSFLYSAVAAVRRTEYLDAGGFDENMRVCEDDDLGHRLVLKGYRIVIDTQLAVGHKKQYSLMSVIKSDFTRSLLYVGAILGREKIANICPGSGNKVISHINTVFTFGSLSAIILFVSAVFYLASSRFPALPAVSAAIYLLLSQDFIRFVFTAVKKASAVKYLPVFFIDQLVFGASILFGFAGYFQKKVFSHGS